MKKLTEEKLESTTLSHPPVAAKGLTQQKKKKCFISIRRMQNEPRKVLAWQSRVKTKRSLTEIYKPDHLIYVR